MKPHEYADIFPMMDRKEFNELKKDIKENGQIDPIIIYQGKILDGRNRYQALTELGITNIKTKQFDGTDPLQFAMSTNLRRRHLSDSQKAIVGTRWEKLYSIEAEKRMKQGKPLDTSIQRSREQAGLVVGVSGAYIQQAKEVIRKKPEMEEAIMKGEVKLKQVYRDIKLEEKKQEIEKVKEVTGTYDVIVIDPPWKYDEAYDPDGRRGTPPYPTMEIAEIRKIKLPSNENCVLWLWTTHKYLPEAYQLLNKWGFEYKTTLVWDKVKMGLGKWLRNQAEFCLLAIKGKPYWNMKDQRDILTVPRTDHSRKPDEFYKLVESLTAGRKLDYFARNQREGWATFGTLDK